MGGTPLLALSIAAFPEELDTAAVGAVFSAAERQVRAAGALLAGGHTIRDDEPKYGLAVVGTVHPKGLWPKAGARPGDAIFLTKPLGTALVLGGHRKGLVDDAAHDAAVRWMSTLNRDAADALRAFEPNCVTDVTGFGLLGHAHEVAERSGVRVVLESDRLPALDGALDAARAGVRNAGHPRNAEFARAEVEGAPEEAVALALDPQTAGGLLLTLPADRGVGLQAAFDAAGLFLQRVGRVEAGAGTRLL
jgi:selenide,water dikinase